MAITMMESEVKSFELCHALDLQQSFLTDQAAAEIRRLRARIDSLMGMHANDVAEINSLRDAIRERNAEDAQGPVL